MDGQKFDKLTRAFAAGTDRRTLLKIFGGASVAAVAGVKIAAPSGVFAQGSVPPGGECVEDGDCVVGLCSDSGICYCEDPVARLSVAPAPQARRIRVMAPPPSAALTM